MMRNCLVLLAGLLSWPGAYADCVEEHDRLVEQFMTPVYPSVQTLEYRCDDEGIRSRFDLDFRAYPVVRNAVPVDMTIAVPKESIEAGPLPVVVSMLEGESVAGSWMTLKNGYVLVEPSRQCIQTGNAELRREALHGLLYWMRQLPFVDSSKLVILCDESSTDAALSVLTSFYPPPRIVTNTGGRRLLEGVSRHFGECATERAFLDSVRVRKHEPSFAVLDICLDYSLTRGVPGNVAEVAAVLVDGFDSASLFVVLKETAQPSESENRKRMLHGMTGRFLARDADDYKIGKGLASVQWMNLLLSLEHGYGKAVGDDEAESGALGKDLEIYDAVRRLRKQLDEDLAASNSGVLWLEDKAYF